MTLIKSISGIRSTIGGKVNDNLTPIDTVKYAAAYGMWLKKQYNKENLSIILSKDARISGEMVSNTLIGLGIYVIDIGLSITSTVETAVILDQTAGVEYNNS